MMMTNRAPHLATVGRTLAPLALIALVWAPGCAGPTGLSTPTATRISAGSFSTSRKTPSFKVFTAGVTPGFPATASAQDIVAGPTGDLWFTDPATPAIGRISQDGKVTEFTAGLPNGARPYAIVPGPDGNVWFSDYRGVAIGRVTPKGNIVEFSNPKFTDENATGVAFGADGTPWLIAPGPQPLLAHVTPQGTLAITRLPSDLTPDGTLASDASGNLWFVVTDKRTKAILVERPPQGGLLKTPMHMIRQLLPCCPHLAPKRLTIGPDGHPWFTTLGYGHKTSPALFIGTMGANGIELFKVTHLGLSHTAYPSGMAAGASGLWFTGGDPFNPDGALWQTDTHGQQVAYDIPYDPIGLAVDAKGDPWFTAQFTGLPSQIVRVRAP